jgi:hypothetical protein
VIRQGLVIEREESGKSGHGQLGCPELCPCPPLWQPVA